MDVAFFKVFLDQNESNEKEIKIFSIPNASIKAGSFKFESLLREIRLLFPILCDKTFSIYWKDKDEDNIRLSSDADLLVVLKLFYDIKSNKVFKLYIQSKSSESFTPIVYHPYIICDNCKKDLKGFRYKCMICPNYDLCAACEQNCFHSEHPMLRIPYATMFNRETLKKILKIICSYASSKSEGKHCSHYNKHKVFAEYYSDMCKRKKKNEKSELTCESDELEDFRQNKQCHGKRRNRSYMCKDIMEEILNFVDSANLLYSGTDHKDIEKESPQNFINSTHIEYLRNVASTIASLLNPLGVNVDFEVRSANDHNRHENLEGTESKSETRSTTKNNHQSDSNFNASQQNSNNVQSTVEEISHLLSKQNVNEFPEREDWVHFEDLKQDIGSGDKNVFGSSSNENIRHFPDASPQQSSSQNNSPRIDSFSPDFWFRDSLEKMISMGFTNESGYLTRLLKEKNGDINQVLEVLSSKN